MRRLLEYVRHEINKSINDFAAMKEEIRVGFPAMYADYRKGADQLDAAFRTAVWGPVPTSGYRRYMLKRFMCGKAAIPFARFMDGKRTIDGANLVFNVRDDGLRFFYFDISSEPDNEVFLRCLGELSSGSSLIDVGANFGQLAHAVAGSFKSQYLIEPNPQAATFLRTLFKNRSSVSVIEAAASDRDGVAVLRIPGHHSGGASLLALERATTEHPVRTTTLDEIVNGNNISPAVVKIDVEGAEHIVLAGAKRTIAEHKPIVAFETMGREQFESCRPFFDGWIFHRINGTLVAGLTTAGKIAGAAKSLLVGPRLRVETLTNVDGYVSLVFAVHPSKMDLFSAAVDRFATVGVRY